MIQLVINYLKSKQLKFATLEGQTVVLFGIETSKAKYKCVFDLREEESLLVFYSIIQDFYVQENKRDEIAVMLTKINYGLIIGNFEMDFNDGEIRYKTSIDFEGADLAESLIDNLFKANLSTIENFYEQLYSSTPHA